MHLDAPAAIEEFRRLRVKHAALAESLGVRIGGERWLSWIASSLRRSGHPFRASGMFVWVALRWRRPSLLARAAGTLAGERAVARVRRVRPAPEDTADAAAAARWVDAFATAADPLR